MGPVARSMYLESVNAGEVYKIIQTFKSNPSENGLCWDQIDGQKIHFAI